MKELSDCRILIVDDVRANVQLLAEALRDEYKVSFALDGEAALKAVDSLKPDLVLLDIVMPGLDGYAVLQRLRSAEPTRELPVMFLSSLEDVSNKARGFELGANDYLTKPFELLEVKARVKSLLKAKSYADAVKAALERDLSIAKEIQLGILPTDPSECARGTALDVAAILESAQQVGGDLFLTLRTAPEKVLVAVGDVSGKGVPASLFMAVTMTLLRSLATEGTEPAAILERLNRHLSGQNPRGMFVTLSCALFDLTEMTVTLASAGHPSPVLLSPGRAAEMPFPTTGTVCGLFPRSPYGQTSRPFQPGDCLVFYSDGVSEAFSPEDEEFGYERLMKTVDGHRDQDAKGITAEVLSAVREHAAGRKQSDDITVLAVRHMIEGTGS